MPNGKWGNHKKAEYPDLFRVLEIEEETYTLPNYWQEEEGCTLKHVKEGSGRALNGYEKDNVKEHNHPLNLKLETETFDIDLGHTHHFRVYGHTRDIAYQGDSKWSQGDFILQESRTVNVGASSFVQQFKFFNLKLDADRHTDGSTKGRSDPINVKVKPYESCTAITELEENTVKNISLQFYIDAKVLV